MTETIFTNATFLGQVRDKVQVLAKFIETVPLRSKRTPSFVKPESYKHVFEDREGRQYIWITKNEAEYIDCSPVLKGDTVILSGTVKENCIHNGTTETRLTYCRITKDTSEN